MRQIKTARGENVIIFIIARQDTPPAPAHHATPPSRDISVHEYEMTVTPAYESEIVDDAIKKKHLYLFAFWEISLKFL